MVCEVLQDLMRVFLHVPSKLGHFLRLIIQAKSNKHLIVVHLSLSGLIQVVDFFQLE